MPSTDEIESLLIQALEHVSSELLWVNPDCGLKTRGYDETRTSLEHLVEATARVRESLAASQAASVETAEASAV